MPGMSKGYREASLALTLSGITGLLAGLALGYMTGILQAVPGLMVLIPPAIAMRGNIFGALGSRLGTSMHTGVFSGSLEPRGFLAQNVYAATVLTVAGSVVLGYVAKGVSDLLGVASVSVSGLVLISVLGGALSGVVLLLATVYLSFAGFRRGWDMDNAIAPLVTAIGDFVTLPALYASALVYLWTPDYAVELSLWLLTIAAAASLAAAYLADLPSTRRIAFESAPPLVAAAALNSFAGVALETQLETLVRLPALLVLVPPFLEEAGALGSVLSSRLASRIHTGLTGATFNPSGSYSEFRMALLLSLYVFPLVGVLTHASSWLLGLPSPGLAVLVLVSLFSGVATTGAVCIVSFLVSVLSFRRGLDPDNYAIPLVTSFVDVVGVAFLVASVLTVTALAT